ncbi:Metallo-beta-lactamase superfamily protein [Roseivivax jejudonensis]|uniref:Metallo-beta-lactamase superfamily protein n=1 Tax=Roseivivax jejudonensis TaxID=1529041 RepID=A0A1X6YVS3_9RHOB|nr:MBL fold metallo-hydrolase [Roseivivax jejudonensis]SLN32586.1 Metallo-beta-lactamase superfamily protein [Roseivivax jejudonensis]
MVAIHRRLVCKWLMAAGGASALTTLATKTIAEVELGQGVLQTVSDGHLVLPESFVIGDLPADEAREIVETAGLATDGGYRAPCNLALWRTSDATVLFDAGSGSGFMPSAGELLANLDAVGVAPGDVTHVIFTHGHPDHFWGVLDDFDEPLFANARHVMSDTEVAYWSDPATLDALGEARQSFAVGAARRIELLGDRLERVADDASILPGVQLVPLPGHTAGHVGAQVTNGDASALVVGDAIGNGHLALARPEWPSPADHDPERAIATRTALLDRLAASGETVVGFHLPDGGLGSIARDGDGYLFETA